MKQMSDLGSQVQTHWTGQFCQPAYRFPYFQLHTKQQGQSYGRPSYWVPQTLSFWSKICCFWYRTDCWLALFQVSKQDLQLWKNSLRDAIERFGFRKCYSACRNSCLVLVLSMSNVDSPPWLIASLFLCAKFWYVRCSKVRMVTSNP